MPRDMLGDAATLGDGTDTGKARVIMRNGKYPAVPAQSPVFADYAVGDVEQADVGHHARFLAVDVYPLVFVEVGADILFRKVAHIRERQPREGAEQVEVAVQVPVWRFSVSPPSAGGFPLWSGNCVLFPPS